MLTKSGGSEQATATVANSLFYADDGRMKPLLLLLLVAAPAPVDHPRTYLASIVGVPLKADERIESFSIDTWGVTFNAVCRIPYGWRIRAGNSGSLDGVLEGKGSQGVTWLSGSSPGALQTFALITLYGLVQRSDIPLRNRTGVIPATSRAMRRSRMVTESEKCG